MMIFTDPRQLPRGLFFASIQRAFSILILSIFCIGGLTGCSTKAPERSVVVYTSVDQVFSEPILKSFEEKTGIRVRAVYDVESSKTTGLINRLIAEKDRPQADVFWSSEVVQTLQLKGKGVLAAYRSPGAAAVPSSFKDPDGYWAGFAGRARVLIVNKKLLAGHKMPRSISDFISDDWPAGKIGMANPVFGTTATQAAALYALWGPAKAKTFFEEIARRGVRIVDGNSVVRDLVASGDLLFGLTDTDDAFGAKKKGLPVEVVFPDQGDGQAGTLVIPNTVVLLANANHTEEAKAFIDYLLSQEVEQQLMDSGWCFIPIHKGLRVSRIEASHVKAMSVRFEDAHRYLESSKKELTEIFIR